MVFLIAFHPIAQHASAIALPGWVDNTERPI